MNSYQMVLHRPVETAHIIGNFASFIPDYRPITHATSGRALAISSGIHPVHVAPAHLG
jgi:hypothetical protein